MSILEKCTSIASAAGVIAVAVEVPGNDLVFFGDSKWRERLRAVHLARAACDVGMVRLLADGHTVIAQRESAGVVVVAVPSQHPVSKSLHRMIRRAGRIPKPRAEPRETKPRAPKRTPKPLPDPAKLVAQGVKLAQPISAADAFG